MTSTTEDRQAALSPGLAIKTPVRVATTGNLPNLAGLLTIDGVLLAVGNRILVKNQTNPVNNGVYRAASGNWVREPDFDGARDLTRGCIVLVLDGVSQSGQWYELTTTDSPILPGTSALTFILSLTASTTILSFIQAGVGAVVRTGQDKMRDIVSVKDYGVVLDGATDTTAAYQAAIATGLSLFQPDGTAKITSGLTLATARQRLYGAGPLSIIQQSAATSKNVILITGNGVVVENLRLIHNGVAGGTTQDQATVQINSCDDAVLQNCWIENGETFGVMVVGGNVSRTRILFNRITGTNPNANQSNSADIYLQSGVIEDPLIMGNQCISPNKCLGIALQPQVGGDVVRRPKIVDNLVKTVVEGAASVGGHGIMLYSSAGTAAIENPLIAGNTVRDCQNCGIYLRGIVTGPVTNAIVQGNHLENVVTVGTAGALEDAAIALTYAPRASVTGNAIVTSGYGTGSTAYGIRVHDGSSDSVVGDNHIRTMTGFAIMLFGTGATNSDGVIIRNNTIDGVTGQGIWVKGPNDNVRILGNICDSITNDGININATGGNVNDCLIQGNVTKACGNAGINLNNANVIRAVVCDNQDIGSAQPFRDGGAVNTYRRNNRLSTGPRQGRAVLVNGTVTVNTAEIQAGDNVSLTRVVGTATTRGILTVGAIVAATSFVIRAEDLAGALSADDDSTVFWEIVH